MKDRKNRISFVFLHPLILLPFFYFTPIFPFSSFISFSSRSSPSLFMCILADANNGIKNLYRGS